MIDTTMTNEYKTNKKLFIEKKFISHDRNKKVEHLEKQYIYIQYDILWTICVVHI